MISSIGLVEFNSVAKGIEATDAMLKAAQVDLLFSRPVCAGKYISLVYGDVAAVKASIAAGSMVGEETTVDEFVLANVHPQVIPAISATSQVDEVHSLGVIETFSVASAIVAADRAAKAADVRLIEVRLAVGLGGKSFVTLTGDVAATRAAVETGADSAAQEGLLVRKVVIPSPRPELIEAVL